MLRLESEELPAPGPGEARVRHTAIGVNFIDTYHRSGLYPVPSLPSGLGVEAVGIVEALGEGVRDIALGTRVGYATVPPPSAYSDARNVSADRLIPLPPQITDQTAAACLLQGMTAEYLATRTVDIDRGAPVLVHAAAGGVGLILCQWLKLLGAHVIGTVGTAAKADLAAAHGCDVPVVYTRDDFVEAVRHETGGRGVAVVYDSVGKDTFERSLACLARRGMMVSFGNASGAPPAVEPLELSRGGSLFLTRPTLGDYIATREELLASANALLEHVRHGRIRVNLSQTWPLHEVADCHRALEARQTTGSVVLMP